MDWQVVGVVLAVVVPIAGAFWALIRHGLQTIERHGERIAVLENEVKHHESEISKVREVRHEILEGVSKSLASWYLDIMKKIGHQ